MLVAVVWLVAPQVVAGSISAGVGIPAAIDGLALLRGRMSQARAESQRRFTALHDVVDRAGSGQIVKSGGVYLARRTTVERHSLRYHTVYRFRPRRCACLAVEEFALTMAAPDVARRTALVIPGRTNTMTWVFDRGSVSVADAGSPRRCMRPRPNEATPAELDTLLMQLRTATPVQ